MSLKSNFLEYIESIKKRVNANIYTIINVTLISNPYITKLPKKYILGGFIDKNLPLLFIKSSSKFYIKQLFLFLSYIINFFIFKIFYKKRVNLNSTILIDVFFLVDNIIKDREFKENYFLGLYDILDNYIFLPRLYGANQNPFKLIEFLKIISKDKREFLFEFELLKFRDFLEIIKLITLYPFKTLKLIQKDDRFFNIELIEDIEEQQFEAFSRYILGKNIAKLNIDKVYSWSEFQVVERTFNYGVRSNSNHIKIYACQFYLTYDTYFNTIVSDIDFKILSSPHIVLVNGDYYILDREYIKYKRGVSLRYRELFKFNGIEKEKYTLILGSYIEKDTQYILNNTKNLKNIIFKNHPAVNINKFNLKDIKVVDSNIYKLFKNSNLVISTASGTAVEAVACGLSVIIVASQDNLTSNPLVEYGKGKIWDIALNGDDIERLYNKLLKYRKNNRKEIENIALWYKSNFFIEPTKENIIKAFDMESDI